MHNHWDQCLIYVETAEIFTFLEPALPQLPSPAPGWNTPGSELVSGLEAWAGQAGPYPPGYQPVLEAWSLVHKGDPAQTYLLTCRAQVAPSQPSVRQSRPLLLLLSPQPDLQEDRGLLPPILSQASWAGGITLSSDSQGIPPNVGPSAHPGRPVPHSRRGAQSM